ncbi:glycosyltransferase family 4 protein [Candidatus Viridilinea mediisalina]|uniref:Glycosyl transferase family 1 n=1 Tax=Candidatus Viridilinea mediisalina TaxID=2024553 RepID=A0A2A6RM26_9CHLR|nr:glycosyltransferase family 1 protein [Candidatus Viridilinea mediisalina]PDW03956.1 glycosyl transferase family 1 [Candidatus Viridilinea mediisalina]
MCVPIAIDISRLGAREYTGTERYTYELLAALAKLDRFRPYTLYSNGLPARLPLLGPNVSLRNIPAPRLWTHMRLGPTALRERPALLFIPAHVVPLIHPPSVVTIHDLGYHMFPEAHTARRRLELELTTRWSLRAARHVIAISQTTKADLVHHYRADPARISVVYHGVQDHFTPTEHGQHLAPQLRQRYHLAQRPYLLYVGTIQPRKNLVRLLEAFAQALPHLEEPPLLVLAGREGWLSSAIVARTRALGLEHHVRFPGYIPDADLPALLRGALAFVFPSLYEGFGMPVLEAMACGTPVLTANGSALREVADTAALLVDPTNTDAIAAGLLRLISDAHLREALRERGLARAAMFTWERCAQLTLAVLLENIQLASFA